MSKASLVVIKSMGIGDLVILIANIHAISKFINEPVIVLAQKSTHASAILKNDPHVKEVIELDKKGFFNIVKKIKYKRINQSFIYSDSIRLYLISKLSGIPKNFHYNFFSKTGKNFFRTAKEFTENIIKIEVNPQSKIYYNSNELNIAAKKFNITNKTKNIIVAPSASGPTKRWNVNNYIKLLENINEKFNCKFFLAGGLKDETIINQIMNSSVGKNCISFSQMQISDTLPIIASCQYYVGNDTGWGHISAGLNLKSLFLFMDSPPLSYGIYSNNIEIIVPENQTIETCKHNTRGKDKISFNEVFIKFSKILN
jgi:heptosyltransferase II